MMRQHLENMQQVRAALLIRGWRSLADWAKANGFLPVTARRVVYDWWHRHDRDPLGGVARQVMAALRSELKNDH